MPSYLLQEDGVSHFILEDSAGLLLLEESTAGGNPSYFYQAVPKLFSGPQKPLGLGPDPELTGAPG